MSSIILNRQSILKNDSSGAYEKLLNSVEQGILAVQPNRLVRKSMSLDDRYTLKVEGRCIDLMKYPKIIVFATGKAAGMMAQTAEEVLTPPGSSKSLITKGLAIVPPGIKEKIRTDVIEIHESDHPTPTERGMIGAKKAIELMEGVDAQTLVMILISGGASSLTPMPHEEILLEDKIKMNGLLLGAGAEIAEINAVRKHLSAIKAGRLIEYARKGIEEGAIVVPLIISDVVGDDIGSIGSGLTAPDSTTYFDAYKILKKYDLIKDSPERILKLIQRGIERKIVETPKPTDPIFRRVTNFVIGNNKVASMAAIASLKAAEPERKFYYLGSELIGDVSIEGKKFAKMVVQFQQTGKKIGFVGGGERTVILGKSPGRGGRNQQELLVSMSIFQNNPNITGAYIGTDGIDGKSNAAGGLLSSKIYQTIQDRIQKAIENNNANPLLESANATIITGPTSTNVYDLKALLIN